MRILFVADVFGAVGRRAVEQRLPALREELSVAFCVVNGENAADGKGITPRLAASLEPAPTSSPWETTCGLAPTSVPTSPPRGE